MMEKETDFSMGRIMTSFCIQNEMIRNRVFANQVFHSLRRFSNAVWGDLTPEEAMLNKKALQNPEDLCLFGVYPTSEGKIYIITNRISETPGDHATIICFPDEY